MANGNSGVASYSSTIEHGESRQAGTAVRSIELQRRLRFVLDVQITPVALA
jgi:hypothetical protein